jgi:uncharacterized protein (TIGR02284 family)
VRHAADGPNGAGTDDHLAGLLTQLMEVCGDGRRGFEAAAGHATDRVLQHFLRALAVQRQRFATELAPEIGRLGGLARDRGTSAGALHRGWLTLTLTLSGHDDAVVIREVERGERVALHAYTEALDDRLPARLRPLLERQRAAVHEAHARLAAMASP